MKILAIESSCDDTSAAVIDSDMHVLSNIISGQDETHNRFGGVVPELASRSHLQAIQPVVNTALEKAQVKLEDIDLIAATQGPGLTGSLLVGFSYAKALAQVSSIPFIGVDHMAGHILAIILEKKEIKFPFIALIASGGTTSIFRVEDHTTFYHIGRTRDDAAGEVFDKVAKILGLPYPGGPHVSSLAADGRPQSIKFPRAWLDEGSLDFSFSGLKTAVLNHVNKLKQKSELTLENKNDICASFQAAVIEVLVTKTITAAKSNKINIVVAGGGVSANGYLREQFGKQCKKNKIEHHIPHPTLCTDNGAMIGVAGYYKFLKNGADSHDADVFSRSQLG